MINPYTQPDAKSTLSGSIEAGAKDANDALSAARRQADKALDGIARTTEDFLVDMGASLDQASDRADDLAHRGADAVRRAAQQLREGADRASTRTVGYIKDEPIKALLMAAAAGAALAVVLSLVTQARRRY